MTLQEQILVFLDECLQGTDCFLVSFKIRPTHNFKVYLDSDTGFTLEKSVRINRMLRKKVDESGLFPEGDYSLEVSSPGVDAPLQQVRQYLKNIGRKVEIEMKDPEAQGLLGRLLEADESGILIELLTRTRRAKKGDPAPEPLRIAYDDIKQTTVCIEFS